MDEETLTQLKMAADGKQEVLPNGAQATNKAHETQKRRTKYLQR